MKIRKEFKTCFISLILLISLLSVFATLPEDARAQFTEGTTLYFHDFLSSYGEMDQNIPTAENGSAWPPDISNIEEWTTWFLIWLEFKDMGVEGDFNKSDWEQLGVAPFKITGYYEHYGEELEVEGGVELSLYFSSTLLSKISNDELKVSMNYYEDIYDYYDLTPIKKYDTTTKIKSTLSGGKTQLTTIFINDVSFKLYPGNILTFSIEIIPSKKLIHDFITNLNQTINQTKIDEMIGAIEDLIDLFTNQSLIPELNEIANITKALLNQSKNILDENLSILADLANDVMSSSFIYDSVQYPSSVTLPGEMPGAEGVEDDNVKKYYLHTGDEMDVYEPTGSAPSEASLSDGSRWDGPTLETSKILKEATAILYIEHQNILRLANILKGKITVTATLLNGNKEIDSSEKTFDWTIFLDILPQPEMMIFTFDDLGDEIEYGEGLSLEVSANVGGAGLGRYAKLFYDSDYYPSYLSVKFDETDHIKVTSTQSSSQKVALGGSVIYNLSVVSDLGEDEVRIATADFSIDEKAKWDIDILGPFNLTAGVKKSVEIVVTSTYNEFDSDAYQNGEELTVSFAVSGENGRAFYDATVEVSEDEVEYDILVVPPVNKDIKHGEQGTYVFKVINNNTGFWPDDYVIAVSSENDWLSLSYDQEDLKDVAAGDGFEINAIISVPEYTDVSSDKLTFTVKSKESNEKTYVIVNVTTTVVGPNIIETMYHFFETLGDDFGLADALGSSFYAALILATIAFIIIFIIIILLVYFLTIKYVNLVCLERIKKISPSEEARFELTIQNPFKRVLSYEIRAQNSSSSSSESWEVSLDTESIVLEPKQSKTLTLIVKPTDYVKPDGWVEVKIVAKVLEKHKSAKISMVTSIKDANSELRMYSVFHWPRVFRKGDIVTTSFKLENKGNVAANGVSVVLYVNGEEKNKVEDITIPRGGYADIEMPWVAVKGKNEVDIVVK